MGRQLGSISVSRWATFGLLFLLAGQRYPAATASAAVHSPAAKGGLFDRIEVLRNFSATTDCDSACAEMVRSRLQDARVYLSDAMNITAGRVRVGGLTGSRGSTFVYFRVDTAPHASHERSPAEAKVALAADTTSHTPKTLSGGDVVKYHLGLDMLSCDGCLTVEVTCHAGQQEACKSFAASSCQAAGACTFVRALCEAVDEPACVQVANMDPFAAPSACVSPCEHHVESVDVSAPLAAAAHDEHTEHGLPLGDLFPFLMISLVIGTAVKTALDLLPRNGWHPP
jgi:hypothetical protein